MKLFVYQISTPFAVATISPALWLGIWNAVAWLFLLIGLFLLYGAWGVYRARSCYLITSSGGVQAGLIDPDDVDNNQAEMKVTAYSLLIIAILCFIVFGAIKFFQHFF